MFKLIQNNNNNNNNIYIHTERRCNILVYFLLTDRIKTNPVAYNMYGLLLERQELYKTAVKQLQQ